MFSWVTLCAQQQLTAKVAVLLLRPAHAHVLAGLLACLRAAAAAHAPVTDEVTLVPSCVCAAHSGMLPCFLQSRLTHLCFSSRSSQMSR